MQIQSLGQEYPLEKAMTTRSSILAWKIPWTEAAGELQSMGSQRVRHDLVAKHALMSYTICIHAQSLSRLQLFATPWTIACQAPLSMGFSRQEYWSGLSFPSPGDHPDPGIEPASLASPALASRFFATAPPGKPSVRIHELIWRLFIYWNATQQRLMVWPAPVSP